jgi:hypothetical protein
MDAASDNAADIVVMSGWARHITPPIPIAGWLPKPFEGHRLIEFLDRLSPKDAAATMV